MLRLGSRMGSLGARMLLLLRHEASLLVRRHLLLVHLLLVHLLLVHLLLLLLRVRVLLLRVRVLLRGGIRRGSARAVMGRVEKRIEKERRVAQAAGLSCRTCCA